MKNRKLFWIIFCALALAVLLTAGFGIWRAVIAPRRALDLNHLSAQDTDALYSQKNKRKNDTPAGLNTLLGPLRDSRLAFNGNAFAESAPPAGQEGAGAFLDREWVLTDKETYDKLHQDPEMQRDLQVRALIKLALTQNCERVCFSVEYAALPEGGDIARYMEANGGAGRVRGEGGYTLTFSADWASRAIGRDIKAVAASRAEFQAFVQELELFEPIDALIVPGAGRR